MADTQSVLEICPVCKGSGRVGVAVTVAHRQGLSFLASSCDRCRGWGFVRESVPLIAKES